MKTKITQILLSSVVLLLGDGVYGQAGAQTGPANPMAPEPQFSAPVVDPIGAGPKPKEPADVDEKLIVADDGIDKDDPTKSMNEVYDEEDPAWYKANQDQVPCLKIAEEGMYDLSGLKNQLEDWHATDKLGNTVHFNFCYYTDVSNCDGVGDNFAYLETKGSCTQLTSDSPQAEIIEASSRTSLTDAEDTQEGLRIERAGGSACPADDSRQLTFTIDIWCNPAYSQNPQDVEINTEMDEYPTDPCNVYVSMEHADGCIFWDMRPPLKVLGILMIGAGAMLMVFGMRMQKQFMRVLVRVAVFIIILIIFWKLHCFDTIDPTALTKRSAVEGYAITTLCIILAFVGQYIAGLLFTRFLRFGPTLIGLLAGWWFSIYLIISMNGFFGSFQSHGAADFISPIWATVIELFGAILGGAIGNCYSFIFIVAIQTCISSYLIMRGCTLLVNFGYPNEMVIMNAATSETNSLVHLGWMFYFYIIWFLAMWIAAFKYQVEKVFDDVGSDGRTYMDDYDN